MAIGFARMEFVKRSIGKNVCAKAAYNGRTKIQFEGTEFAPPKLYNWSYKEPAMHHDILLPDHVDEKFKSIVHLWNEIEKIENRVNSQVAIELVLALPDDEIISLEDKIELTKSFVKENFIVRGFGAQINIHSPEEDDGEEKAIKNWHAHVLVTPRRFHVDGKSFETKKPRDLLEVKKGWVVNGPEWGKMWTHHQNQYFEGKGLSLRVDPSGIVSQKHLGPVRMRGRAFSLMEVNSIHNQLNTIESLDPKSLLKKITETQNIFTKEDVERYFTKHLNSDLIPDARKTFWEQVEILQLFDKEKGEPQNKFTTQEVLTEEKKILRIAERMNGFSSFPLLSEKKIETVTEKLNQEQSSAFYAIIKGSRLSCIEGLAGTGKSYLLAAIKDAYKNEGYVVRGFGPDNATAQVLEKCGIAKSENVYRFLYAYHYNKIKIKSNNEVWIVDEAGKLGSQPFLELLKAADKNGVQIIFSGDTHQLPSVSRGRIFKGLIDRFGSQFLGDIQRQKYQEQREIAKKLATGEISEALDAISRTGGFKWSETKNESIEHLAKQWAIDQERFPYSSTIVLAHTNAEVRVLNEFIRTYRKEKGELGEKEYLCETFNGKVYVSQGDQIEFRKKDNDLRVENGQKGILIKASENKFVVSVKQKDKVREITFNPQEYTSYQLGYATTNYRSQGDSADRVYVLLSKQMNREMFYVALTRHIRTSYCFVSKTENKNLLELKKQIFKSNPSELAVDFLTQSEIIKQTEFREKREELDALRQSDSMTKRLKGQALNLFDKIQNNVSSIIEKHTDRLPNQGFFHHVDDISIKGSVVEVKDFSEKENGTVSNSQTVLKTMLLEKEVESSPSESQEKQKESSRWKSLSEEAKAAVKRYYKASDSASNFYSIVKAESEALGKIEKAVPHYKDWQLACAQRNEYAYQLTRSLQPKEIKEIFSKKSIDIVKDRAERYEATLNKQNSPHIEDSLKDNLDGLLFRLFPEGPTRRDSKGYRFGRKCSLSVICQGERTGAFYNYEKESGGGLVRLIEDTLSLGKEDAVNWARNFLGEAKDLPVSNHFKLKRFESKNNDSWVSLKPDESVEAPVLSSISKKLDQQYTETARHAYRDSSGKLLFYKLRLVEKQDPSKKAIFPLSYGYYKGGEEKSCWSLKGFKFGKDSLYNLDMIYHRPNARILIVEGEKTADAANKLFEKDNILAVTWHGGAAASAKSDWSPLFLRDVLIWPDNDAPGFKAAESICSDLRRVGVNSLKVVNKQALQKMFPEKWDLADSLPQGKKDQDIRDLILSSEDKAIGLGDFLVSACGEKTHSLKELLQAREILWRVDERLRPQLETKYGGKSWEIQNAINTEASSILAREKETTQRIQKTYSIEGSLSERLSFAEMVFQARHGKLPEKRQFDEMRQAIGNIELPQMTEKLSTMPHDEKAVAEFIRNKHVAECFESGAVRNMPVKEFEAALRDLLYTTRRTTEKQVKAQSLDLSLDKEMS